MTELTRAQCLDTPIDQQLTVVIPAAGVGKRMQADCPKQYLKLNGDYLLSHTVKRLLSHPNINQVIIALGAQDQYFADTQLDKLPGVKTVIGGKERVDSVLAGLKALNQQEHSNGHWVLVHDGARPCVKHSDISRLIESCLQQGVGGLLAVTASDTIKLAKCDGSVDKTLDRSVLWQAQTPQMYPTEQLINAIERGLSQELALTDESSAIELAGFSSQLVEGSNDNIKVTRPADLPLAEFILTQQLTQQTQIEAEQVCE